MSEFKEGGLVLSREVDEAVIVGGDVRVSVVSMGGGRVRLRFQAPDGVVVDREEVHEAKKKDKEIRSNR